MERLHACVSKRDMANSLQSGREHSNILERRTYVNGTPDLTREYDFQM